MALKEFFTGLWQGAKDVSSLDVVTLTGRIELKTQADKKAVLDSDGMLDPEGLRKQIANQLTASADMHVLGMTHVSFDKDSVEFLDEASLDGGTASIHQQNVAEAKESRQAIWQMVVQALPALRLS